MHKSINMNIKIIYVNLIYQKLLSETCNFFLKHPVVLAKFVLYFILLVGEALIVSNQYSYCIPTET